MSTAVDFWDTRFSLQDLLVNCWPWKHCVCIYAGQQERTVPTTVRYLLLCHAMRIIFMYQQKPGTMLMQSYDMCGLHCKVVSVMTHCLHMLRMQHLKCHIEPQHRQ